MNTNLLMIEVMAKIFCTFAPWLVFGFVGTAFAFFIAKITK